MSVKLITYDLNAKGQKHAEILAKIKSFGVWARLSESSYAIQTQLNPEQLYNQFKHLIDKNDNILIITLKKPYQGWADKEVIEWLESELSW
ncbi:hypothetical protein A9299_00080 [Moraxella osloensis]|uniref:Uncharacterized protein n=1 Tax=Faucicola osloensis TaxID=34062 RepID=A0AA91FJ03_FAUOS|nr:hypothetical protein [Moraxella osloensis]OBX64898.1 hypothetical protein A9299_00080 [Moraxella osloensis]